MGECAITKNSMVYIGKFGIYPAPNGLPQIDVTINVDIVINFNVLAVDKTSLLEKKER